MRQDTYGFKTCQACGHSAQVIVSSCIQCDTCGKLVDTDKAWGWVKCDVFPGENAQDHEAEREREVDFCGYECYLKWLAAASAMSNIDFIAPGVIYPREIAQMMEGMRRYFAEVVEVGR